jgi:Chaperone of endosialidase
MRVMLACFRVALLTMPFVAGCQAHEEPLGTGHGDASGTAARCGATTCMPGAHCCTNPVGPDRVCTMVCTSSPCLGVLCVVPRDGGGGSATDVSVADASSDPCAGIARCQSFDCPNGGTHPIDRNGCVHTCECDSPGQPDGGGKTSLRLWYTCGDPVCNGPRGAAGVPACTVEQAGGACTAEGSRCDPRDSCNRMLVCAASDPRLDGGCPVSRASFKQDIKYLQAADLARYGAKVLRMRLATWRYKHDPSKERLGFIVDDDEASPAADGERDMVDLYGYASLAIAAIQTQDHQIQALRRKLANVERALVRRDNRR